MSEKSETFLQKQKNRFTRRDFLKLSGVAAASAILLWPWMRDRGEQTIAGLGLEMLKNPEALDAFIEALVGSLENFSLADDRDPKAPKVTENRNFSPALRLITEAVSGYRKKHNDPVRFTRIKEFRDDKYYLQILEATAKSSDSRRVNPGDQSLLGYNLSVLAYKVPEQFFPLEARQIWSWSDGGIMEFADCLSPRSGFYDRVATKTGLDFQVLTLGSRDPKRISFIEAYKDQINKAVSQYLIEIKEFVEQTVTSNQNQPISASKILEYVLGENNGDLAKSLRDTAIFLKFMARNDLSTGKFVGYSQESDVNQRWISGHILDEYGRVGSYRELDGNSYKYVGKMSSIPRDWNKVDDVDQDLSRVNQDGKLPHTWNILSLPDVLPPTVIKLGVMDRQYRTFATQGPVKTAADFRTLLELNAIEKFITTL
ncbi:MAG: twin-arginine translocation signal domain-containing protein [Patescibacteria group bacterium]